MRSPAEIRHAIALHALAAVASCTAPIVVDAQENPDAWREDIAEIHLAALEMFDRMDQDLIRLQEAWKSEVAGKEVFLISDGGSRVADAAEIDDYCNAIALTTFDSIDQIDQGLATLEDGIGAMEADGTLTAQALEQWTASFIHGVTSHILERADAHWRAHVQAAGYGYANVPSRAAIVAAEAQKELDKLAESLHARLDEVGARLDAGEVGFDVYNAAMIELETAAKPQIDAMLRDARWTGPLDEIRGSLNSARREHAQLLNDWSTAVESSLNAGSETWRRTQAETAHESVNVWIGEALDRLWADSGTLEPRVFVAPYRMWSILMQDRMGADLNGGLGEPLVFQQPDAELLAAGEVAPEE